MYLITEFRNNTRQANIVECETSTEALAYVAKQIPRRSTNPVNHSVTLKLEIEIDDNGNLFTANVCAEFAKNPWWNLFFKNIYNVDELAYIIQRDDVILG